LEKIRELSSSQSDALDSMRCVLEEILKCLEDVSASLRRIADGVAGWECERRAVE
jgi:hypothetical protein